MKCGDKNSYAKSHNSVKKLVIDTCKAYSATLSPFQKYCLFCPSKLLKPPFLRYTKKQKTA